MGQWRQAGTGLQRFPRVTTDVPVRITTVDPEIDPDTGTTFFRSAEETTANVSRGGAFVRSWEPLAAGRRVVVTLPLPEGGELQLVARVAWTRREIRSLTSEQLDSPGYGIEFVGGSRHELATLDRYLTSLEPRPSTAPEISPQGPNPRP